VLGVTLLRRSVRAVARSIVGGSSPVLSEVG
jgi:hypothetical protein